MTADHRFVSMIGRVKDRGWLADALSPFVMHSSCTSQYPIPDSKVDGSKCILACYFQDSNPLFGRRPQWRSS